MLEREGIKGALHLHLGREVRTYLEAKVLKCSAAPVSLIASDTTIFFAPVLLGFSLVLRGRRRSGLEMENLKIETEIGNSISFGFRYRIMRRGSCGKNIKDGKL